MSQEPAPARKGGWIVYIIVILVTAAATAGIAALLVNMFGRHEEGKMYYVKLKELDENTIDPAIWGENFPRQYASYKRTVDIERTKYGGSEAEQHLTKDTRLKRIFAGYAFSIDYREERGHAYMLSDQDETERVKKIKQPGACLHCHSSIIPAYREAGGGDGKSGLDMPAVMKGFEKMCKMPLKEARKKVEHPVSCLDCHDPKTMQLRVTRPGFINGIAALAKSDDPVPHLPSIQRWRKSKSQKPYDPNVDASRQEMRSFVCGQCHVEYYFAGEGKLVTYPWAKGLKMEKIEEYYDEINFADWTHAETGARVLKAQHPEFEMWSQGIHARSGVACADCHMPYVREGAVKVSDHRVRSPLLNIAHACGTCHRYGEDEIKARALLIQDRNKALLDRAEDALIALIDAAAQAKKQGMAEDRLKAAQKLQRQAQWRVDFVNAENSMGFHAAQEAARILGEAIDFARQGQIELLKQK